MGWGYGRILGGVGWSFQVIPDLRWEMVSMLDFGMTYCEVGVLKEAFLDVYGIVCVKDVSVAALLEPFGGSI
jgi:hypothetical protein